MQAVQLLDTGSAPLVYAQHLHAPGMPTALIYGEQKMMPGFSGITSRQDSAAVAAVASKLILDGQLCIQRPSVCLEMHPCHCLVRGGYDCLNELSLGMLP